MPERDDPYLCRSMEREIMLRDDSLESFLVAEMHLHKGCLCVFLYARCTARRAYVRETANVYQTQVHEAIYMFYMGRGHFGCVKYGRCHRAN